MQAKSIATTLSSIDIPMKLNKNKYSRAINSAVECYLHTVEVAGSSPASPIPLFSISLIDSKNVLAMYFLLH